MKSGTNILIVVFAVLALVVAPAFAHGQTAAPPPQQDENVTITVPSNALFYCSVGASGLATFLKWQSSWKQTAPDVLHAETSGTYAGKYYTRGTVYDWGIFGITTVTQILLVRKFPQLAKTFAYVNFGNGGLAGAQFGYNLSNH